MDLALNNQQWLICHKTNQNQLILINRSPSDEIICVKVSLLLAPMYRLNVFYS